MTYLAKSRDFQDACARHLELGTSHPRDYELLYGRGVTADAQRVEIERYTTHLVRAGVDERSRVPSAGRLLQPVSRPA